MQLTNLRNELIAACKDETLPKPRREAALECLDELDLGIAQIANHNYTPDGLDIIDLIPQMTADAQREIHLFVKAQNKWWATRPTQVWDMKATTSPSSSIPESPIPNETNADFEDIF